MEQAPAVGRNLQIKPRLFAIALLLFLMLGIEGGLLNVAWTYMKAPFGVADEDLGIIRLLT